MGVKEQKEYRPNIQTGLPITIVTFKGFRARVQLGAYIPCIKVCERFKSTTGLLNKISYLSYHDKYTLVLT